MWILQISQLRSIFNWKKVSSPCPFMSDFLLCRHTCLWRSLWKLVFQGAKAPWYWFDSLPEGLFLWLQSIDLISSAWLCRYRWIQATLTLRHYTLIYESIVYKNIKAQNHWILRITKKKAKLKPHLDLDSCLFEYF